MTRFIIKCFLIVFYAGLSLLTVSCTQKTEYIAVDSGISLVETSSHISQINDSILLDFGKWRSRRFLADSWSFDEIDENGTNFIWMLNNTASVSFPVSSDNEALVTIRCRPFAFDKWQNKTLTLYLNKEKIGSVNLISEWQEYTFKNPSLTFKNGINELTVEVEHSFRPVDIFPDNTDKRSLSLALDYIIVGSEKHIKTKPDWNIKWQTKAGESRPCFVLAPGESFTYGITGTSSLKLRLATSIQFLQDHSSPVSPLRISIKKGFRGFQEIAVINDVRSGNINIDQWIEHVFDLNIKEGEEISLRFECQSGVNEQFYWLIADPFVIPVDDEIKTSDINVCLITIDTLRADCLGAWGCSESYAPILDKLTKQSFQFSRCYSNTDITNPSHVSILTSSYLYKHNVYNNLETYSGSMLSLADIFYSHGYNTCAVVSAQHLNRKSFGVEGFKSYFDVSGITQKADSAISKSIRWIDSNKNEPWFLWVHLFDPHTPYSPPERFIKNHYPDLTRRFENKGWNRVVFDPRWNDYMNSWLNGVKDTDYPKAAYQGEIDYIDTQLERLMLYLFESELFDKTTIAVIADHGESLGENDIWYDHIGLYDPQTHIPLLIRAPDIPINPYIENQLTESIDLAPSILKIADLPMSNDFQGSNAVNFGKPSKSEPRYVFLESRNQIAAAVIGEKYRLVDTIEGYFHDEPGVQFIQDTSEPTTTEETKSTRKELNRILNSYKKNMNRSQENKSNYDKELAQKLRMLGYIDETHNE